MASRIPTTTRFLAAETADSDPALISRLTAIVNAAYLTEANIFVDGYKRVNEDEMREIIRAGELAVAFAGEQGTLDAVGCIRIMPVFKSDSDSESVERANAPIEAYEFGLLANDDSVRGSGLGRALIDFAEDFSRKAGMKEMQLALLVPLWIEGGHPFKNRLHDWYTRMGYKVVRVDALEEHYPELAKLLLGKCDYTSDFGRLGFARRSGLHFRWQFAEIVYAFQTDVPAKFFFDNIDLLMEPTMPLEGYPCIRGSVLITAFIGFAANLPGYVAYRPQTKQLILAVAGTASVTQAIYDIRALSHRHKSGRGFVHTGFWRLYKGMKRFAVDGIRKGIEQHEVHELVVTGHSMGAAVSQLFVLEALRNESLLPLDGIRIRCVGFGGPRSGTKELVRYWRELVSHRREKHGEDSFADYSIKMLNDGVPSLPPLTLGYRHFSQRPYYFLHGRLYHVPEEYNEYSLFHATSDEEDAKPPIHPRGGHNYYNGRDLERFERRIGWLDRSLKKEGDWKQHYIAKIAKHEWKAT
uniref:Triacylglycerol lipase n=1 Tax=Mycena chlorophos TaxID=658473 RepID=A0ABQ0L512_MYCCL|nr:triacylglycerol lipase [Mycena chlorophos]